MPAGPTPGERGSVSRPGMLAAPASKGRATAEPVEGLDVAGACTQLGGEPSERGHRRMHVLGRDGAR